LEQAQAIGVQAQAQQPLWESVATLPKAQPARVEEYGFAIEVQKKAGPRKAHAQVPTEHLLAVNERDS
jgi:hypothetical protein